MKKEESKLVQELRHLIVSYLNQHKNITIHGLSKKCGVASSTLRRIVMGETREEPKGPTVLGIVTAITKETNIKKLLDQFDGEIGASLKKNYENLISEPKYLSDLNDILSDPIAYIVYKMTANHSGVTVKKLTDMLGLPAKDVVENLKEMELLYEDMGRVHAFKKSFSLPPQVFKRHIPELVRLTNFGSHFVKDTIFVNWSESVNLETYDKAHAILSNALCEIKTLLSDKKNLGEIPFFMISILDTMEVPSENAD